MDANTTAGAGEKHPYHHGDLRAALLVAAEQELAERGVEAFSLRQVAKRAGVSHAAPAHHFSDAGGLLTALAAVGFGQFLDTQVAQEALADPNPRARLVASGLGYVTFARARPALFRLMFGSKRPNYADPALGQASNAAFDHLVDLTAAAGGQGQEDIAAVWAAAHGVADLLVSGRLKYLSLMPPDREQAMIERIIDRALPALG